MLVFGIDVVVLMMCGITCVTISFIVSCALCLSQEEGIASMVSAATTATFMVVSYIVMARVLDTMLGTFGW